MTNLQEDARALDEARRKHPCPECHGDGEVECYATRGTGSTGFPSLCRTCGGVGCHPDFVPWRTQGAP
jgi:DnaJ-class molecular chaperone